MVQTSVWSKLTEREAKRRSEQIEAEPPDADVGGMCGQVSEALKGQTSEAKFMKEIRPRDYDDTVEFISAIKKYCDSRKTDDFRAISRMALDRDLKTCRVFVNPYVMTFELNHSTGQWVSKKGPAGSCGVISIGTLWKEKDYGLWNYTEQRVVTNKAGSSEFMKCSDMKEHTLSFSWKGEARNKGCQYIEFGM